MFTENIGGGDEAKDEGDAPALPKAHVGIEIGTGNNFNCA